MKRKMMVVWIMGCFLLSDTSIVFAEEHPVSEAALASESAPAQELSVPVAEPAPVAVPVPAAEPVVVQAQPEGSDPLTRLMEGNTRFASGGGLRPRADEVRRADTSANGQKPFCSILSCSDSRVPAEILFDQGIGDLFVVRVAGNVADTDEIGSIEYGVGHLETPLLLVLGHTACGAVSDVATGADVHGNIPKLVENIKPALSRSKKAHKDLKGKELVPYAIEENVWQSIDDIYRRSPEIRKRAREGKVKIVGGVYDLASGKVNWLGAHPEESKLLKYTMGENLGAPEAAAHAEAHH